MTPLHRSSLLLLVLLAASCSDVDPVPAPASDPASAPHVPRAPSPKPSRVPADDPRGAADDFEKGGDVMVRRTDFEGALLRYERSVASTDAALERDPGDVELLLLLARRVERAAYAARCTGRIDRALAHYARHVSVADELVTRGDAYAVCGFDALRSLQAIGDMELQSGRAERAIAAFASALERVERRHLADPEDRLLESNLAIALGRLGFARQRAGDLTGARDVLGRAEAVARRLAVAAPDDTTFSRDWAVSLLELANAEDLDGAAETAAGHLERSLSIWRDLVSRSDAGDAPEVLHQLSVTAARLARTLLATGALERAESLAVESLAILDDLERVGVDPLVAARERCARNELLADVAARAGRPAEAVSIRRRVLAVLDTLQTEDESSPRIDLERAHVHERIAVDRANAGDAEGARTSRRRALDLARVAAEVDPSLARAAQALTARLGDPANAR